MDHGEREHRRLAEKLAKDRHDRSQGGLHDTIIEERDEVHMIEIELAGVRQVDQIDAVGDFLTCVR